MNFWKKVDAELTYLGKTRKELANSIGFDVTNISFGIKRNSIPAADTALKVSRFLGVPLDYLLEMEEENSQTPQNPQILEIENRLRRFSQNDVNAILAVVNAINEKY
ncbi:MAG: helix-turn-helix transcriptional regulator [Treponema sp.]|uniref:helix-turn-helix domain-containing protein n=1 Tax=Treponema sp. TaxID=166 RepID=UPI0025FC0532|nr:helix-turn-helix transcriptional regulator [Treponema sp.]MBQ8678166.1 helix-turn-helix transcriptional regulator [Treponema sp.]